MLTSSMKWLPVLLTICAGALTAQSLPPASSTSLTLSSGSVTAGTPVTISAQVQVNGANVTIGQVTFLDGKSAIGTAQIVAATQTASLQVLLGAGSHTITAQFAGLRSGTQVAAASTSAAQTLSVTNGPTTTAISSDSTNLTATVTANSLAPLSGQVSFVDQTNGNYGFGTPALGSVTKSQTFLPAATYSGITAASIPDYGWSVATGDLNGDGIVDVVITHVLDTNASLLFGKGDGTFNAPIQIPAEMSQGVAIADLNGDGIADLVFGDIADNAVAIVMGQGGGSFAAPVLYPVGNGTLGVAVADLNGDGIPDVVVVNGFSKTVGILLGKGDGTLLPQTTYPVTTSNLAAYVAIGDFNEDGIPDVAVSATTNGVEVYLGNGDGTLQPPTTLSSNAFALGIIAADFNNDGHLDIAVADENGNVAVFIGNGQGTFQPAISSPAGNRPAFLAVGDFNGDGIIDAAITDYGGNSINVLSGVGDGTFAAPVTYAAAQTPVGMAAADLNGDGAPDLVWMNANLVLSSNTYNGATAGVLLNSWTQTATATLPIPQIIGSGTHNIGAAYGGNSFLAGSSSTTPLQLAAAQLPTALSLLSSASGTIPPSQLVTLTATLNPYKAQNQTTNGESVTFYSNGSSIGSAPLSSGTAMLVNVVLPGGVNNLTAQYQGDANFVASASTNAISVTVLLVPTVSLTGPTSAAYGSMFTATATSNDGVGATITASGACTINNVNQVTMTSGTGICNLSATWAATSTYAAALKTLQISATLAQQTVAIGAISNPIATLSYPLTATSTSGGTPTFASTTPAICTVSGSAVSLVATGFCTVTASVPASADYSAGSAQYTFTVAAPFTITPDPGQETIKRGILAGFLLQLKSEAGFKGNVTLGCSGGPSGAVCADLPMTVPLNGQALAVSGILFPAKTTPGTYTMTFTATSGSLTTSATAQFTVVN